jgi:hypothetical protein
MLRRCEGIVYSSMMRGVFRYFRGKKGGGKFTFHPTEDKLAADSTIFVK